MYMSNYTNTLVGKKTCPAMPDLFALVVHLQFGYHHVQCRPPYFRENGD